MSNETNAVEIINAISGLITVITGLITVIGGTYIAIRQHLISKRLEANSQERAAQIGDVMKEIAARAEDLKGTIRNGQPH